MKRNGRGRGLHTTTPTPGPMRLDLSGLDLSTLEGLSEAMGRVLRLLERDDLDVLKVAHAAASVGRVLARLSEALNLTNEVRALTARLAELERARRRSCPGVHA